MATVDAIELETQVKDLYRHVAEQPHGAYHFETARWPNALGTRPTFARASRTSSACDLGGGTASPLTPILVDGQRNRCGRTACASECGRPHCVPCEAGWFEDMAWRAMAGG
jgi:hypothetical protein